MKELWVCVRTVLTYAVVVQHNAANPTKSNILDALANGWIRLDTTGACVYGSRDSVVHFGVLSRTVYR